MSILESDHMPSEKKMTRVVQHTIYKHTIAIKREINLKKKKTIFSSKQQRCVNVYFNYF